MKRFNVRRCLRLPRHCEVSLTTLILASLVGWTLLGSGEPPARNAAGQPASPLVAGVTDDDALQQRFMTEIWPLLTRPQADCVTCHGKDNPSQLHFPTPPDARTSFALLMAERRLDPAGPSSLLARIASPDPAQRMPPQGMSAWTETDRQTLARFAAEVAARHPMGAGPQADETFPVSLATPFHGAPTSPAGTDNTFLSYFQLKRKVQTLFGDDWVRVGHDRFAENLAQFNGADFVHRFDESTRPSPSCLSALCALSGDIAARAYLAKAGPFTGRPDTMPMPGQASAAAVRSQIALLYRRLLFRAPSAAEDAQATALLSGVASQRDAVAGQPGPLDFALEARDDDGQQTTQQVEIQTAPARYGLTTLYVDESDPQRLRLELPGTFTLRPGDDGQRLQVSNRGTSGHVSFQSVTLIGPLPATTETEIGSDSPGVQVEGAWNSRGDRGKDGYDDGNNNKGESHLIVPLAAGNPGKYRLRLAWMKREPDDDGGSAERVPVSVYSHDRSSLGLPATPPIPPKGEARFLVDQTVDTIPFIDLQTAFQFGHVTNPGVEIANSGTHRRVVADAVAFVPARNPSGAPAGVVLAAAAVGHDDWPLFKPHDTIFNMTYGPTFLSDDSKRKGELRLRFAPTHTLAPSGYYRTRLTYPGEVDNETRVPVTVRAARSSPIIRLRVPDEAPVGAAVTLDASASYNVQHSPLHYTWRQIGGPRVVLTHPHTARLSFTVPSMSTTQAAWEGLCRALVLHPDFLFTRPRTLLTVRDPVTRRHLQLVKIAQDLVGRPPTADEVARLDAGATLTSLVDKYLAGPEFETFYYRRIRLYLESHGTPTQDEPARLWRYLLHTGRPYTELLTADYTITPDGRKQRRPDYCGHSGVLSMQGFIEGKPGLPHFNYAAQVCQKFLGYVFEVTPAVIKARGTQTAASTVDPKSLCYSCHQVLTPLAYQRSRWSDDGAYKTQDDAGHSIDDTDRGAVVSYPFKGEGLAAFAAAAQRKERFHRAIMQIHFVWYFGREMRYDQDERGLYRRLWDETHRDHFALGPLVRAIVTSPEYLGGPAADRHRKTLQ